MLFIAIWLLESIGNPNPMSIFLTSTFTVVFGLGWLHLATREVHTILWRVTLVTAAVLIHLQVCVFNFAKFCEKKLKARSVASRQNISNFYFSYATISHFLRN